MSGIVVVYISLLEMGVRNRKAGEMRAYVKTNQNCFG
jgi:hypothetical protein